MSRSLTNIHQDAILGKNVIVEPFATIEKDVVIGDNCWIGPNVVIHNGARIGNNVKIFPGAVISGIPQDLKFNGEETTCEIGDNTVIREFVTLNRGTEDRWKTKIGANCLIMAYVHLAHDCFLGDNCILSNGTQLAGHVTVEDFAIFGGTCAVHQFSKIGSHVMIGGGSLVRKDVPPFVKAGREPISYSGVNVVGLRRRGFSNESVAQIQEIYRIIYQKSYNTAKAIKEVEELVPPSPEKDIILNFIKSSERGIMKGYVSER
jgi:UDP-N-acetylglucosamine acyltransferase